MAFKFYVNNVEKNVETNASFRSTQDESLDDGSLVLEWVDSEETIKPRTPVAIKEFNNNNELIHEWNFIVLSDDVEPVDKANGYFSHRLTVVQNTHELSHRLLRNSVFQQPLEEKQALTYVRGYLLVTATSNGSGGYNFSKSNLNLPKHKVGSTYQDNIYRKDLIYIESREKINTIFLDVNTYCLHYNDINFGVTTGGYQANVGWNAMASADDKKWMRNRHFAFNMILEYRSNSSSADPDYTQTITINAGNSDNFTKTQQLASSFFTNHGAGWYSLALDTSNLPNFNLSADEINFDVPNNHFPDTPVVDVPYPNILIMMDIKLRIDTYYYTLYDILDSVKKQSVKKLNNIDRMSAPYSLSETSDLKSIIAPDMNFNGLSVFDAVTQVFNYIDAVPVIYPTKTINNVSYTNLLDYEFLNEFNGETLPSDYKFADKKTRIEDKYYDNQIITQYRNAKQPTSIDYPAKDRYKKLEANVYGVVDSISAYKITTDKPIEKVNKLNIILPTGNIFSYRFPIYYQFQRSGETYTVTDAYFGGGSGSQFSLPYVALDIAPILVESSIYRALPVGQPSAETRNKNNTLMFVKGTNYIPIGTYQELGYTSINLADAINKLVQETFGFKNDIVFSGTYGQYNLHDVYYSIEYVASFEGQTMVESPENKKEGQFVVAQNSSSTALNKMGSNMLGFISKSGNESKAISMSLTTYDSRLTKGSIWVDSNNNRWIANTIKISFTTSNQIITEVEFVKNFNMISQRTQVDEEIKYTALNYSLLNKGFENVNEYLYFSANYINDYDTAFNDTMVEALFKGTFNADISQAYPGDCAIQLDTNTACFIPMHIYGTGNIINFEINYEDSKQAGMYLDTSNGINGKAVLYTEDGFGDNLNVYVYKQQTNGVLQYSNYPIFNGTDHTTLFSYNYKYYKRENEILSFNYGIALMAYPGEEIYFGEEFISQNYLIPNNKYFESNNRKLYFFISQEEKYGVNDKKALGDRQSNLNVTVNMTNKTITIEADWGYYANAISWCIADENDNIYIAANQELTAANSKFTVVLHFGKYRQRI